MSKPQSPMDPLNPQTFTNVPSLLTSTFVGRDKELAFAREILCSNEPIFDLRRVAFYGMTGVGKTQTVRAIPTQSDETQ